MWTIQVWKKIIKLFLDKFWCNIFHSPRNTHEQKLSQLGWLWLLWLSVSTPLKLWGYASLLTIVLTLKFTVGNMIELKLGLGNLLKVLLSLVPPTCTASTPLALTLKLNCVTKLSWCSLYLFPEFRILKNRKFMGSISEQTIRTKSKPFIQEMDSRYGGSNWFPLSPRLPPIFLDGQYLNQRLRTEFGTSKMFA